MEEQESKKKRTPKGLKEDGTAWKEGSHVSKELQSYKDEQAAIANEKITILMEDITGDEFTETIEFISPHTQHQILERQMQIVAMYERFTEKQKEILKVIIEHPEIYIQGRTPLAKAATCDPSMIWRFLTRPDVHQFLNAYFEHNNTLPKFAVVQELCDEFREAPRGKYRLELLDRIMKIQGWDGSRGDQTFIFNNPSGTGQIIITRDDGSDE